MKKNIVILGAGFGGLACALRLNKLARRDLALANNFNIVLVDKKNYHLYTPALYEAASTAAGDGAPLNLKKTVVTPFEEITADTKIKFIQGAATQVKPGKNKVIFEDGTELDYEYLVLALGSEPVYFDIPGLKEHSIPLKTFEDALHIRSVVRSKFMQKPAGSELEIVVGGAGPAGVELSAELIGYIKRLNKRCNKKVMPRVTLVEGGPNILPGFHKKITETAGTRLTRAGLNIKTSRIIAEADEKSVRLKSAGNEPAETEKIGYDALVWTGGVGAAYLAQGAFLKREKRGRIETDTYLGCLSPDEYMDVSKNIYAIGDNACFYDPQTKMPIPGTARVAIEQAKIAAENIYRDITGRLKVKYRVRKYPFAIPLGGKYALTQVGPLLFVGFTGWALKQLIELYYLISITDNWSALWRWLRGLALFSKND